MHSHSKNTFPYKCNLWNRYHYCQTTALLHRVYCWQGPNAVGGARIRALNSNTSAPWSFEKRKQRKNGWALRAECGTVSRSENVKGKTVRKASFPFANFVFGSVVDGRFALRPKRQRFSRFRPLSPKSKLAS